MFSVLLLTVVLGAGMALARIERLEDREPHAMAGFTWEPQPHGDRYLTQEEILGSLQVRETVAIIIKRHVVQ